MGTPEYLTLVLAVIAATGASLVTALFTRPKINAEASATKQGSEVSISADARAWAETFQKQAEAATAKAAAAEAKSVEAEERAEEAQRQSADCQRRMTEVEHKMTDLLDYTLSLQNLVQVLGGEVPEAPRSLRPHL